VNVTVIRESGDQDISVTTGSTIVFDNSNWNIYQPVVLSAETDDDTDNGTAQIKISSTTPDIEERLVTAVELEMDIYTTSLTIEGSEATLDSNRAYWYGVVPITITTDPNLLCAGNIQGTGTLLFQDSYSYLTYTGDGGIAQCYFQEYGQIDVSVEGSRDCSNPPQYLITAHLSKNTTERTFCSDGGYWTQENIGGWKSYAVALDSQNVYTETYADEENYYRVQLLSPPRLTKSYETVRTGRISKRCDKILRTMMVQMTLKVIKYDEYLRSFYLRFKEKNVSWKATIAEARKMFEIIYDTLKNEFV
jgi:hypothetical protein